MTQSIPNRDVMTKNNLKKESEDNDDEFFRSRRLLQDLLY